MIIVRTPFRMSFFGGGTDYKEFYDQYGGCVISTTFNKYCYVNVRHLPRFFEFRTHLTYSKMEYVNDVNEIEHPAIREAMKYLDMHELRITYDADLPARSGLGTSSAFAVGLLHAFHSLKGQYVDKKTLAKEAIYLERVLCQENGGIQDQIATAFGGLNRIDFKEGDFSVNPIIISSERKKELNDNLMLFFTGFTRFSSDIALNQKKSIKEKTRELLEMKGLVMTAEDILVSKGKMEEFGRLLDHTWRLKRGIARHITTNSIDEIYQKALQCGALGGKLLGAGGGGFFLFYVEPDKQDSVKRGLKDLVYVPFVFENNGTRILHYTPEHYN